VCDVFLRRLIVETLANIIEEAKFKNEEGMCLVVCECVVLCADICCVHLQGTLSISTLSLTRAGELHFFMT
jgi:hypothetical protein